MRTAQQVDGDYADQLGRCECCGKLTAEVDLIEVWRLLVCGICADASVGDLD